MKCLIICSEEYRDCLTDLEFNFREKDRNKMYQEEYFCCTDIEGWIFNRNIPCENVESGWGAFIDFNSIEEFEQFVDHYPIKETDFQSNYFEDSSFTKRLITIWLS